MVIFLSALNILLTVCVVIVFIVLNHNVKTAKNEIEYYVDLRSENVCSGLSDEHEETRAKIEEETKKVISLHEALMKKIADLESGASPDYELKKEAADQVNSFNIGLSNLLGYDPFEALKKSRTENGGAT